MPPNTAKNGRLINVAVDSEKSVVLAEIRVVVLRGQPVQPPQQQPAPERQVPPVAQRPAGFARLVQRDSAVKRLPRLRVLLERRERHLQQHAVTAADDRVALHRVAEHQVVDEILGQVEAVKRHEEVRAALAQVDFEQLVLSVARVELDVEVRYALISDAFQEALLCTNDPECMHNMPAGKNSNGAACHSCCMISETACENGNRMLDRGLVVPIAEREAQAYFRELVIDLCQLAM